MSEYGLADFIADQDGLATRLLASHHPNHHGDCAACGGPQSGRPKWPCGIHAAASAVQHIADDGDDVRA